MALTPIRRVVTGNDENGKSKVVWDGPSPGTHEAQTFCNGLYTIIAIIYQESNSATHLA